MTNSNEFISAGYFIIKSAKISDGMDNDILPENIVSASDCICDTYPHVWALSWWEVTESKLLQIQNELNLNSNSFKELQQWINNKYEAEEFGFPNVFMNVDSAREFHKRYLQHISDLKLIGIALSKKYLNEFLEKEKPEKNIAEDGIYIQLSKSIIIDQNGSEFGFEIIGIAGSGNIHSHICNRLEKEFKNELGIQFNDNGFIVSHQDAIKAAIYANEKASKGEAEPGNWYPFKIMKYEF